MENLLAENLVTNFPENVWLHRSAINCLVQLNIFAPWRSQNLIKSQVLRAADYLFQGSLDCLRGANNLRQKRKKMLKKTVPVSFVLSSIAANHIKFWKTRFVWWEESKATVQQKSQNRYIIHLNEAVVIPSAYCSSLLCHVFVRDPRSQAQFV